MAWSGGLTCKRCQADFAYKDAPFRIQAMTDGSLVWLWLCAICDRVIRSEPFSFPPDFEPLEAGVVIDELDAGRVVVAGGGVAEAADGDQALVGQAVEDVEPPLDLPVELEAHEVAAGEHR